MADNPYGVGAAAPGLAYNPHNGSNIATHDYGGVPPVSQQQQQQNDQWLAPMSQTGAGGGGLAPQPSLGNTSLSTNSSNVPSPASDQPLDGASDLARSGTVVSRDEPSRPLGVANL